MKAGHMNVEAILFDLDGIITDTSEFHYRAWRELAAEIGIDVGITLNEKLKGVGRLDSLNIILESAGKKEMYADNEKAVLAARKNDYYNRLVDTITEKNILPGIRRLLDELRREKVRMAICSASRNAPRVVSLLGVGGYFDYMVDPARVSRGKPAPDICLDACRGLSVAPEAAVGIEDAEAGIEAFRRAGVFSIGVGVTGDITLASTKDLTIDIVMRRSGLKTGI
jgi:beta-phosphoglucomutase